MSAGHTSVTDGLFLVATILFWSYFLDWLAYHFPRFEKPAARRTRAHGVVGPDLTHVGSRLSLAAGTLPNEPDAFQRWIAHTTEVKPAANMPAFHMLPQEDLRALAAYLEGLK